MQQPPRAELRDLRLRRGLTLRELGALAGVDFTYLSKLERSKVGPPSRYVLERLAKALAVPPEDLRGLLGAGSSIDLARLASTVLERSEAVPADRDQWQVVKRLVSEDLNGQYHLRVLSGLVHDLPRGDNGTLRRSKGRAYRELSQLQGLLKRRLWDVAYRLLAGNLEYQVDGLGQIEEYSRQPRVVVLAAQHRNATALTSYLVEQGLPGFNRLVILTSESEDAGLLQRFLQSVPAEIEIVTRPSLNNLDGTRDTAGAAMRRGLALRKVIASLRASEQPVLAVMTVDERMGRRERRLSCGVISLAVSAEAILLPVVARNRVELVLSHSWDKHRIPLRKGRIRIGPPFAVVAGRGHQWRQAEARRLDAVLCELDKGLGRSFDVMQLPI